MMSSSYFMHLWTAEWKSERSTGKWVLYVGGIIYYLTAGTIKIFETSQKGTIIKNFKYCLQKSSVGLVSPGGSFCLAGCQELTQSSGKKGIFHPVASKVGVTQPELGKERGESSRNLAEIIVGKWGIVLMRVRN